VDLDGCAVRIVVSTAETDDGRLLDDDPKSQAERRRVAFPKDIAPELRWHLERFAQPGMTAWSSSQLLWALTCMSGCPPVAVAYRCLPWRMAR